MTRELKIALIVGFSAVLFVAILLSDHFSKVHKSNLVDAGASVQQLTGIAPSDQIKTPETQQFSNERKLALADGKTPVADQLAQQQLQREKALVENDPLIVNVRTASQAKQDDSLVGQMAGALDTAKEKIINGAAPAAARLTTRDNPHQDFTNQLTKSGGTIDNGGKFTVPEKTITQADPSPAPGATAIKGEPAPKDTAKPAEGVHHMVASGESLYDISKKYYGNGGQWKKIAEANPGRVASNGSVRTGVQLLIPQAETKTVVSDSKAQAIKDPTKTPATSAPGSTPNAAPGSNQVQPKSKPLGSGEVRIATPIKPGDTTKPTTPGKTDPKADKKIVASKVDEPKTGKRPGTYTVRAGDTAGKISQQLLGTSKRADELLELNNVQEESLRVGMVLKVPSA